MDTEILKIPAVALRGMVILPGMIAHFDISRDRSIRAIEQCMMDSQKISCRRRRMSNRKNRERTMYTISV